jgi:glycosyltransferase involved in cell wall biosynthesis
VGTVACLKPQKAPDDFVAVAKRVCEVVPEARFVLIGDGDLRPWIESLIRQNGLHNRLYLAGWRRDIPTVMKAFDAFLLTSHWEGLPRVLLEARTIGLPVVATRVGGVEEVIVQGRHGWLSEAGDIAGLSAQLIRVLQSRDGQPHGRSQSAEALPKEFYLEEMVKRYESLYDRLLNDRRGGKAPRSVWSASHS